MSTLKTHNLQSPDAASVNIALAPNNGMVVAGISTFNNRVLIGTNIEGHADADDLTIGSATNTAGITTAFDPGCHATLFMSNKVSVISPNSDANSVVQIQQVQTTGSA